MENINEVKLSTGNLQLLEDQGDKVLIVIVKTKDEYGAKCNHTHFITDVDSLKSFVDRCKEIDDYDLDIVNKEVNNLAELAIFFGASLIKGIGPSVRSQYMETIRDAFRNNYSADVISGKKGKSIHVVDVKDENHKFSFSICLHKVHRDLFYG